MERITPIGPDVRVRRTPGGLSPHLEESASREDEKHKQEWLQAMPLALLARVVQMQSFSWAQAGALQQAEPPPEAVVERTVAMSKNTASFPATDKGGAVGRDRVMSTNAVVVQPSAMPAEDVQLFHAAHQPPSATQGIGGTDGTRVTVDVGIRGAAPQKQSLPLCADTGNRLLAAPAGLDRRGYGQERMREMAVAGFSPQRAQSRAIRAHPGAETAFQRGGQSAQQQLVQHSAAMAAATAAIQATAWTYQFRSWKGGHSVTVTTRNGARSAQFSLRPGSDMAEQHLRQHNAATHDSYQIMGVHAYDPDGTAHAKGEAT